MPDHGCCLSKMAIQLKTLPNGLRIVSLQVPALRTAYLTSVVQAGSALDPPHQKGMAHLVEHLTRRHYYDILKTIPARLKTAYLNKLVHLNATTYQDYTVYSSSAPAELLRDLIRFEAVGWDRRSWTQDSVNTYRTHVLKEIERKPVRYPAADLYSRLYRRIFHPHPYASDPYGDSKDLGRIRLEDCRHFCERFYGSDRIVLALASPYSADLVQPLLRKHFGCLSPSRTGNPRFPQPNPPKNRHQVLKAANAAGSYLVAGFRVPPFFAALETSAAYILNEYFSRIIRRHSPLSFGHLPILKEFGLWEVTLCSRRLHAAGLGKSFHREIEKIRGSPEPPDDFLRFSRAAPNILSKTFEKPGKMSEMLCLFELFGGGWRNLPEFQKRLRQVQWGHVHRFAKNHLEPDKAWSVAVEFSRRSRAGAGVLE